MFSKKFKILIVATTSILVITACNNNTQAPGPSTEDTETTITEITNYTDYSLQALEEAHKNNSTVVLYFYAGWCPTCRAFEKEILSENDQIPEGVAIIKVDYDSEKELKDKYKVTTQHTMIQIDKDGKEIKKWIGGGLDLLIEKLSS